MAAGLNIITGVRTTDFYPADSGVAPRGSVDLSSGNVSSRSTMTMQDSNGTGGSGVLPSLWCLGILVVLVALRLAYEFN